MATALTVVSAFAQTPTFARADYAGLGNNHVAGDFNGDGKLDLAGIGAMSVAVLLGNGDGTFGARVEYPIASWAQDLALGDFNGDRILDIVVTINDLQIGLALLTGNADGTFNAPVNFPNTSRLDSPTIVATDLDNDGRLDVVIGHSFACYTAPCIVGRTITVMRGNGDGTFQPAREITVGIGISRIAVGDFNRDGIKDLAIAGDSSHVYMLFGVGDGTFNQQTLILADPILGMDNTDIDVADLNGDGIEDLVVAMSLNGSKTVILIGNGDGSFREPLVITEPNINVPQYQALADYNGDGFPDIAIALANGNSGLMEILLGNGDGTFRPLVMYLVPPPKSSLGGISIIAADFNGDGKPDIALGIGGASHSLAVLRNTTGSAPASTLNSVTLSPTSVVGGNTSTGTVRLTSAAPSGGAAVSLSDNSSAVSTPASVTVPAGSTSATFTVTTTSVTASTSATISAVYAGVTRTAALTVNASTATPAAPSQLSPASGATVTQPVTLDWSDVANAASYQVRVDNTSTMSAPYVVDQTVTGSQVTLSGLPAQRLWWRVRARNSAGVFGPFSSTRSFTPQAAPAVASLSSLSVNPTSVVGPSSSTGTATLSAAAPTGGALVTLSSNNAAASVPASVTVPAGATSATFQVTTNAVTASTSVTLTGAYGGTTRTTTLSVTPVPPPATLNAITLSPPSVTAGSSSSGTVSLTSAAPPGGAVVSLSSNLAAVTLPASVAIAAGATTAGFTVATSSGTTGSGTITASYGGSTRSATLTVNPPGAAATLTVTATGRSGERISSSPIGINVAVGSTGSSSFNAGTSLTLSVSNGRDAVWSGACSSGGNKRRSCTFTINGNASVTGNVQ